MVVVGHLWYQRFSRFVSFGVFLWQLAKSAVHNALRGMDVLLQVTSYQIYFTCIQALPVVVFLSFFVVFIVINQVDNYIGNNEAWSVIANLFVVLIVREMAPLLTSLVVIGRSGTAIASELASMVANEEVDALTIMGVEPLRYLVIPRVIGITVSVTCLSVVFSLLSLLFTTVLAFAHLGVAPPAFLQGVGNALSGFDIVLNLFKSVVFGASVALICCFWGLSTSGTRTEIPQATTRAVIVSVFCCFLLSAAVTMLVY